VPASLHALRLSRFRNCENIEIAHLSHVVFKTERKANLFVSAANLDREQMNILEARSRSISDECILDCVAMKRVKRIKTSVFLIDASFFKEIEKSGMIEQLYRK
jgi:hypothetical protein